jgi:hypothetical protein
MIYPGIYRDSAAEEVIALRNDGKTLSVRVRGIDFEGPDFDALQPMGDIREAAGAGFTLDSSGTLCSFELSFVMPMTVVTPLSREMGALRVRFALGAPLPIPNGRIDSEVVELALEFQGQTFRSMGTSGWFEDELVDLQRRLPSGVYMLACINCAFSDYSPVGHGCFGGLACFRGAKEAYKKVNTKADLFQIWDRLTEFVQETYVCPEFERRSPGAGYRG